MAKRNGMHGEALTTTQAVIEALGGSRNVIRLTGATPQVVTNWKKFRTFPASYYVLMARELLRVGKSAPASLWGMKE